MIGRIIGIRIINTPGSDEVSMIAGEAESTMQGTTNIQYEHRKGMVYLVVDCSGSMAGYKISQVKKGILEFAQEAIKKEYLVGLIKFDTSATRLCEPTYDIGDLRAALERMDANGSTNMAAAITLAHEHLGDTKYARAMVVATDGRPDRTQSALQAGKSAKNDGIDIITIGTDDADLAFLNKLSTSLELGKKVSNEQLDKAIATAYLQLPDPRQIDRGNLLTHGMERSLPYPALKNYCFSRRGMAF
jgi:Mg-chelatase subunit ChlD